MLQTHFSIIHGAAQLFKPETLKAIMMACIILHNMIIEGEWHLTRAKDFDYEQFDGNTHDLVSHNHTFEFREFIDHHLQIRDRGTHSQLQSGLLEHLWQLHNKSQVLVIVNSIFAQYYVC